MKNEERKQDGYTPIIIRSKRKTVAIEIGSKGVIVRVPSKMSDALVYAFIKKKENWIKKTLDKVEASRKRLAQRSMLTQFEINSLTEKAWEIIPNRVSFYAERLGVDYARIAVRCQRTRWGSCSSKGNLNFNCLLVLLPTEVMDSVIAHELCHRKHMNHSTAFYDELYRLFPNYKRCSDWLRENGGAYLERVPR